MRAALGAIRRHSEGRLELGFKAATRDRARSNLCFDGADVYTQAEFKQHRLSVFLDTGATATHLNGAFAKMFPTVSGVGGSVRTEVALLIDAVLRVGGFDARLASADVMTGPFRGLKERAHVWAGIDLFSGAKSVTIDFRAMRLTVE